MWKKINAVSEPVSKRATLEIISEDNTISRDIKEVLKKWHKDIWQVYLVILGNHLS